MDTSMEVGKSRSLQEAGKETQIMKWAKVKRGGIKQFVL